MNEPSVSQYVILPPSADWRRAAESRYTRTLTALHSALKSGATPQKSLNLPKGMNILDSMGAKGPKLIELATGEACMLRAARPDLDLVKRLDYKLALAERPRVRRAPKLAANAQASLKIKVTLTAGSGTVPIEGARILAFTNFALGDGEEQVTDAAGTATFSFGGSSKKLERLYIFPRQGFWPRFETDFILRNGAKVTLDPLDLSSPDGLRFHYPDTPLSAGENVRVAVIDSGAGSHKDLKVEKAMNTVTGESPDDVDDASPEGHGTHVCGIIAARGGAPGGLRGLAPAVRLRVYRVVGRNSDVASNFAIAKAIDLAVEASADLLNLSIAGTDPDPLIHQAIERARAAGAIVIAASGNDGRKPVSYPASESFALAVSAMGHKGTFPANAAQAANIREPFGSDPGDFMADFSNIGEDVDFVAPGVGIVSTVPGGYAALDGTSMACPAVTGAAARLLGAAPGTLSMTRGPDRAEAILKILVAAARTLGFQPNFEGHGMIRV